MLVSLRSNSRKSCTLSISFLRRSEIGNRTPNFYATRIGAGEQVLNQVPYGPSTSPSDADRRRCSADDIRISELAPYSIPARDAPTLCLTRQIRLQLLVLAQRHCLVGLPGPLWRLTGRRCFRPSRWSRERLAKDRHQRADVERSVF
jgi:hypothetical protein